MSTFDGSKVNGLANALQSQMTASAPLNSQEFFDYIQENYPWDFLRRVESLDAAYVEEALQKKTPAGHTLLKFQDILIIQQLKRGVTAPKRLKFL